MTRRRRHFTAAQKAEIVRRHVAGKEPVSKLAEEHQLQPSQIHQWIRQVLDHAEAVFLHKGQNRRGKQAHQRRIEQLERKLLEKNEVIAELMQEHVQLKKELGEP